MRGKTKEVISNLRTIKEFTKLRRQARKALWQEAAKDALFIQDIKNVEADFRHADAETVGNSYR